MLKYIAIFVLIVLNSTPMNATLLNDSSMNNTLFNSSSLNDTLLDNSSRNNTLLNNSSLNNTRLNNTTSDDDWFNRSSNLSFMLPPNPLSDYIRIIEEEQAVVKFPAENPIAEKLIWDMINPPEITIPDPAIDGPRLPDGPYEGGCSEPVCDEDGICFSQCVN
jgi:hypothetical protein